MSTFRDVFLKYGNVMNFGTSCYKLEIFHSKWPSEITSSNTASFFPTLALHIAQFCCHWLQFRNKSLDWHEYCQNLSYSLAWSKFMSLWFHCAKEMISSTLQKHLICYQILNLFHSTERSSNHWILKTVNEAFGVVLCCTIQVSLLSL